MRLQGSVSSRALFSAATLHSTPHPPPRHCVAQTPWVLPWCEKGRELFCFFIFYFLILTLIYTNVGGPSFPDHQLLDSLSYFLESWAESHLRPVSTQGQRKDAQYGQRWEERGRNSQTSVTAVGPCQETLGCHKKDGNRTSFRLELVSLW